MTYTVYADVMLGFNILINFVVLSTATYIMNRKISFKRIAIFSVITAVITVSEYILLLNKSRILHLILYAVIYFFMTNLYFKAANIKNKLINSCIICFIFFYLYGAVQLTIKSNTGKLAQISACMVIATILLTKVICRIKYTKTIQLSTYKIQLTLNDKIISCVGYADSGNVLKDYNGMPVIIIDYMYAKKLFNKECYRLIDDYNRGGNFDYEHFYKLSNTVVTPLPYQTITDDFAIMPTFKLTSLMFSDNNQCINEVTAGISKYHFMNNEYQVLLNNELKPIREENSND